MRGWRRRALAAVAAVAAAIGLIALVIWATGWAALGAALAPGGLMPVFAYIGGTATETLPPPVAVAPPSTPAPLQHYSDGSTSERGNIPKVVGQKGGMLSPDGQFRLVTFTVTRIVTDPPCLNAAPPAPAHGHYVEVDLDIVTTADMGIEGSDPTVTFTPDNWFFYPPDGDGVIAGGVQAFNTVDDCELSVPALPESIGASQTVSGSVLLDVAPGTVYLSYDPGAACGCQESWEWPYSDK